MVNATTRSSSAQGDRTPPTAEILVVEDDPAHAELVRRAFVTAERYRAAIVGSLAEARSHLRSRRTDLVIADNVLHDGMGIELAEGGEPTIPLVLMTSHGSEQVAVEALRAGALDYIVKSPEALAQLPRTADRALREWRHIQRRRQAELERERLIRSLAASATTASTLLATQDPRQAADDVVRRLGETTDASRAYWCELTMQDGQGRIRRRAEWCADGVPSLLAQRELVDVPLDACPRCLHTVHADGVIQRILSELPTAERDALRAQRVLSIAAAPVLVDGRYVGFLGLDDCAVERIWNEADLHLVSAVAKAFSIALGRWHQERRRGELATVVEQAAEATIIADRRGNVRYVNPAFTAMSGLEREDVIGRPAIGLVAPGDIDDAVPALLASLRAGRVWRGPLESRRRDGSIVHTRTTAFPLQGDEGNVVGFASIHVDTTAQLQLEEQLRHAQKMEALGKFASGIAHDFNNLIMVILGAVELMQHELGSDEPTRHELETVRRAAEDAVGLTRSLLAFSRRQILQPQPVDLAEIVRNAVPMLRRVMPASIAIELDAASHATTVLADPGPIDLALMNLCINARDAMPDGGTLALSVRRVDVDESFLASRPWARCGRFVRLGVSDTGSGMDQATLARIFEPFFTTKEPGRGTGLGLATVYGIVKQHDGMLDITTVPGAGTTFDVYLPFSEQKPVARPSDDRAVRLLGGSEAVLVVEDEANLREIIRRFLTLLGYRVATADNGSEALRQLEAAESKPALIVSDLVMPGMGGLELYRRLRSVQPSLAFLFLSGHAGDLSRSLPQGRGVGFIAKPFDIATLAAAARRLIDESTVR